MIILSACGRSSKSMMVVLLPGSDGKTGQITVSNDSGSLLISEPHMATVVSSPDSPPAQPFSVAEDKISDDFGQVLSALPDPPLHFTLYFHTGTTILTRESRLLLEQILPSIASRKTSDVSIVGHTDRVGSRRMNLSLGLERASEIKLLLVSQGIDPRIIEVVSHGEDNPLVKTDDEVPEPRNRRVEVILR